MSMRNQEISLKLYLAEQGGKMLQSPRSSCLLLLAVWAESILWFRMDMLNQLLLEPQNTIAKVMKKTMVALCYIDSDTVREIGMGGTRVVMDFRKC